MPDKRAVAVSLRSQQQDGDSVRSELSGELYRMLAGWTLIYREPKDENGVETTNTLFIHDNELRLRRRGTIFLEQAFRIGERLPGRMETPYGPHEVEAITTYLEIDMKESGGVIEWNYNLLMQDQVVGEFRLRLDIREEQSE
jgi:uncharacterized beta-barrel protein YwiB (DUF1934 family)